MRSTSERKAAAGTSEQLRQYNYGHFLPKHFVADLVRTLRGEGVRPGSEAPEFDLEATDGERVQLGSLRGLPVLIHFASGT